MLMNKKPAPRKNFASLRSWARRYAMQALYQWQMTQQDIGQIDAQFLIDQDMTRADVEYFQELLHHSYLHMAQIDAVLAPYLDRPIEQVDPVERAILWVSGYELLYRIDVPYRVIINEGVELAKLFGADQSHKFINGMLDKAAHQARREEIKLRAGAS